MSKLKFGWAEQSITPDKKVSLAGQFAQTMRQKYRLQSAASCPWQYVTIISVPSDMPSMPFIVFNVIYNKMLNKTEHSILYSALI